MPNPSELHIDGPLSTFISGYSNGDYIADEVMPIVKTDKKSDAFQKYLLKDMISLTDDRQSPTGKAPQGTYELVGDTYLCTNRSRGGLVSNESIANADDPQKPFEKHLKVETNRLFLNREKRCADLLLDPASYADTTNGSNWYSDSSTPLADVMTAIEQIPPSMIGETKLVAVCGLELGNALRRHPDLRGAGTENRTLELARIAELFGLDQLFVSNAIYNTAAAGQTVAKSRIWGTDKFAIFRVPTGEVTDEVGLFAATFRFNGDLEVRRWEEPSLGSKGSEAFQVSFADDEKTVQNDMGHLLTDLAA